MTEAEAKTKWCPMIRIERDQGNMPNPHSMNCIGSACMMFRRSTVNRVEFINHGSTAIRAELTHYCGLAQKPD